MDRRPRLSERGEPSSAVAMRTSPPPPLALVAFDAQLSAKLSPELGRVGLDHALLTPEVLRSLEAASPATLVLCGPPVTWAATAFAQRLARASRCLVITAQRRPEQRAAWLDWGALDCVSHPCALVELAARVRTLVRTPSNPPARTLLLDLGRLQVDEEHRAAKLDGTPVELTGAEFELLATLARRAGQVLSRERLLELTGGSAEDAFDRAIDVRISRLRAKLGDDPRHPRLLKTVRGRGYLLVSL